MVYTNVFVNGSDLNINPMERYVRFRRSGGKRGRLLPVHRNTRWIMAVTSGNLGMFETSTTTPP
jgi:hypothetical protein